MTNELSVEEAIKMLKSKMDGHTDTSYEWAETVRMAIKALESQRWIPIKTRPMTEEEKEELGHEYAFMYDCQLPDDGQEVLITDSMGNVELDTFYSDDGCYFESNCDADDVIAWMSKPEPYKESEE